MPRVLRVCVAFLCLHAAGPAPGWAAETADKPDGAKPVPMDVRDMVEDAIGRNLPLPESADWHFDFMAPYGGGGQVVCGRVNYQSLQRKYVGMTNFYAVVKSQTVTLAVLQDPAWLDSSGQEAIKFKLLCNRS